VALGAFGGVDLASGGDLLGLRLGRAAGVAVPVVVASSAAGEEEQRQRSAGGEEVPPACLSRLNPGAGQG